MDINNVVQTEKVTNISKCTHSQTIYVCVCVCECAFGYISSTCYKAHVSLHIYKHKYVSVYIYKYIYLSM